MHVRCGGSVATASALPSPATGPDPMQPSSRSKHMCFALIIVPQRLVLRSAFVALLTFLAICMPFFNVVVGLVGRCGWGHSVELGAEQGS